MNEWHQSHRGYFAGALHAAMKEDESIYLLTGDLGYKMFDKIALDYPNRFINCGASEQAMLGIAVGMAQEGKKPFVYTITSFFLRAAETISLYLGHENAPVRLVGSGRDNDYAHDGYSHDATCSQKFIRSMGLMEYYPEEKEQIPEMLKRMVEKEEASFISLRR
jgi:transketolase